MKIPYLFQLYANKKIFYLRNPGNKGDGLIYAGTLELFAKFNIKYKEVCYPQRCKGNILFVSGGGAFSTSFNHMVDYVNYYSKKFNKIYILPSTFELSCPKVRQFVQALPENIFLYCRERNSYNQVLAKIKNKKNALLNNDMAFYLDYSPYFKKGSGALMAFRGDREAPFWSLIISIILNKYNKDVAIGNQMQWQEMIHEISKYNTIHTNRLHVAICAAMLKKKTYMYSSNYFKQKAVYDYVLKKFYNVKFIQLNLFKKQLIPSCFYGILFSKIFMKLKRHYLKGTDPN